MEITPTSVWQKGRLVFKAVFIGILTLLLLIPMAFISNIVTDREQRQKEAYNEVAGKWAAAQTVTGPLLLVPYVVHSGGKDAPDVTTTRYAVFLPDSLNVIGNLQPEKRHRGIYEVILYRSGLRLSGNFRNMDPAALKIPAQDWKSSDAVLVLGITDLRGIENRLSVRWNGTEKSFDPGTPDAELIPQGVSVPVSLDSGDIAGADIPFSVDLDLKGSGTLSVVPVGKSTTVHLDSPWPTPSFTGGFLPSTRTLSEKGFSSDWTIFNLNRNFPQQWRDGSYNLAASAFGVSLMQPVDFYQKSMRCVKYAILIIALTFTVFFLLETGTKNPVHAFQYLLVGLALCVFYTLLISISEYLDFSWAYGISAAATVGLITLYASWLFAKRRMALVTGAALVVLYGYVFVLMQLKDFALLVGSIGLFVVLGVLMYFSRHINRETIPDQIPV